MFQAQADIASEDFRIYDQSDIAGEDFEQPSNGSVDVDRRPDQLVLDCTAEGHSIENVNALRRRNAYLVKRVESMKSQLAAVARNGCADQVARQCSTRAGLGLLVAAARAAGNGSCIQAAVSARLIASADGSGHSMGRSTVARWELALASSLIAKMALFHKEQENRFQSIDNSDNSGWAVAYTFSRGDAARAKSWRENKLQCCELESLYYYGHLDDIHSRLIWPDSQVVIDNSGAGCLDMTHRQLRITQCVMLEDSVHEKLASDRGGRRLRWYTQVGDCGPDQNKMRNLMAIKFRFWILSLFTGFACLSHQASLSECRTVAMTDRVCSYWNMDWLYYSSLVKLCHLFRGSVDLVRKAAATIAAHRPEVARHGKTKVGKCSTGRWKAVGQSERWYRVFPVRILLSIMNTVFFRQAPLPPGDDDDPYWPRPDVVLPDVAGQQRHGASGGAPMDDIAVEEVDHYKAKMSRWLAAVYNTVLYPEFWVLMEISEAAKGPIDHIQAFMEKQLCEPQRRFGKTHLSVLVCGKVETIFGRFSQLLEDTARWDAASQLARSIFEDRVFAAVVCLVLTAAMEFDLRFLCRLLACPYQLLWLCETLPSSADLNRVRVCSAILGAAWKDLDVTTAKIRILFHRELQACVDSSGILDEQLYNIIFIWRSKLVCEIQECEGVNSIMTGITSKCSWIDAATVAARVTAVKHIHAGQTTSGSGVTRERLLEIQQDVLCDYNTAEYKHVMSHAHRWSESSPQPLPITIMDAAELAAMPLADAAGVPAPAPAEAAPEAAEADPAAAGAGGEPSARTKKILSECQLLLGRPLHEDMPPSAAMRHSSGAAVRWSHAFGIGAGDLPLPILRCFWLSNSPDIAELREGDVAWLCPVKRGNLGRLVQLKCIGEQNGKLAVEIVLPLVRSYSSTIIAAAWQQLQQTAVEKVAICAAALEWQSSKVAHMGGYMGPPTLLTEIGRDERQTARKTTRSKRKGARKPRQASAKRPKQNRPSGQAAGGADGADDSGSSGDSGSESNEAFVEAGLEMNPEVAAEETMEDALWKALREGNGDASGDEGDRDNDGDGISDGDVNNLDSPDGPDLSAELGGDVDDGCAEAPLLSDLAPISKEWTDAFTSALEAFQSRYDVWQDVLARYRRARGSPNIINWFNRDGGLPGAVPLALVEVGDVIEVAHWLRTGPRPANIPIDVTWGDSVPHRVRSGWARLVRSDEQDRLVYPTELVDKRFDAFAKSTRVIHPNIGLVLIRSGKGGRQRLPSQIVLLRKLCRHASVHPVLLLHDKCKFCGMASPQNTLTTCCVCLLTSHAGCATRFAFSGCFVPIRAKSNLLFGNFRAKSMCMLCAQCFGLI